MDMKEIKIFQKLISAGPCLYKDTAQLNAI